jgi:D-alanyl-D-alanine carboxypeptidase (penicillin-binding protein 5/6)
MNTPTKSRHRRAWVWIIALVLLFGGYSYWSLRRAAPSITPEHGAVALHPQSPTKPLPWPASGEAAVGLGNTGVLASNGVQKPLPTASTAKVLTALCVLGQKPLASGQAGPPITFSAADVAIYNAYAAEQGSVVAVTAGEQISEYQALQAMMLPSANNMADSLAVWAFGSLNNYAIYANRYAKQLGMPNTHVGSDASGFDASTTSTAADLVRLGQAAMKNPVLSQIVGQTTATGIPGSGTLKNVNFLLGTDHIVGIKTGNTDQAGGVFISASQITINNAPVTIVTAVIGAPTLYEAMAGSLPLITAAQANFAPVQVVAKGAVIGTYHQPWGGDVPVIASQGLSATAWRGQPVNAVIQLQPVSDRVAATQTVGSVTANPGTASALSVPVHLARPVGAPPLWWRLLHP